jgi:hypothetical protein
LGAPIEASNADRLAWVGVYPLDLSNSMTREFLRNQGLAIFPPAGRAYHIRAFEVDRALIDTDASVSEADLKNQRSSFALTDDDLIQRLQSLGTKVENLELPYKSEYPI